MPLFDEQAAEEQRFRHLERRARFSNLAAERIRAAQECQFSMLPHDELARIASEWYQAGEQATVNANYGPFADLIVDWLKIAARQGFSLPDVSGLLRICRRSAVETDGWNDDVLGEVDAAVNEAFNSLAARLAWNVPEGYDYLTGQGKLAAPRSAAEAVAEAERRIFPRNRLHIPIRIEANLLEGPLEEITETQNLARGGLYFRTANLFPIGARLEVTYPYWAELGGLNRDYPAKVIRVDFLPDDIFGIAIEFLVALGPRAELGVRTAS